MSETVINRVPTGQEKDTLFFEKEYDDQLLYTQDAWRAFVETRYYDAAKSGMVGEPRDIIMTWIEEIYPHMTEEQQGYLLNDLSCRL